MALLSSDKVFKIELQTCSDFAKSLHVSDTAIYYAIKNDLVDYVDIGGRNYIVLSPFTRQYRPNESPRRKKVIKKAKHKVLGQCKNMRTKDFKPCKPSKHALAASGSESNNISIRSYKK